MPSNTQRRSNLWKEVKARNLNNGIKYISTKVDVLQQLIDDDNARQNPPLPPPPPPPRPQLQPKVWKSFDINATLTIDVSRRYPMKKDKSQLQSRSYVERIVTPIQATMKIKTRRNQPTTTQIIDFVKGESLSSGNIFIESYVESTLTIVNININSVVPSTNSFVSISDQLMSIISLRRHSMTFLNQTQIPADFQYEKFDNKCIPTNLVGYYANDLTFGKTQNKLTEKRIIECFKEMEKTQLNNYIDLGTKIHKKEFDNEYMKQIDEINEEIKKEESERTKLYSQLAQLEKHIVTQYDNHNISYFQKLREDQLKKITKKIEKQDDIKKITKKINKLQNEFDNVYFSQYNIYRELLNNIKDSQYDELTEQCLHLKDDLITFFEGVYKRHLKYYITKRTNEINKYIESNEDEDLKNLDNIIAQFQTDVNNIALVKSSILKCEFEKINALNARKTQLEKCVDSETTHVQVNMESETVDEFSGFSAKHLLFFCKKFDISFYCFDLMNQMIMANVSKNRNHKALVCYISGEHFYLVTDETLIRQSSCVLRDADNLNSNKTRDVPTSTRTMSSIINTPTVDEILQINEIAKINLQTRENRYVIMNNTNNLTDLLYELYSKTDVLFSKGLLSSVSGSSSSITKIIFDNVTIMSNPNYQVRYHIDYTDIIETCNKANIQFKNQSIGQLSTTLMNMWFSQNNCVTLSDELRNQVYNNQSNLCHECHTQINMNEVQAQYITPLCDGGMNCAENIKLICLDCIDKKDNEETEYIKENIHTSYFNDYAKKNIFESELFQSYAFVENIKQYKPKAGQQLYTIDHARCRTNSIIHSQYAFPVYTGMDEPKPFSGNINKFVSGLFYVETSNYFPLRRNGWYSLPLVQMCINNNIIKPSNIKYEFIPSLSLSKDHFTKFFKWVYNTIGDTMGKLTLNALIGCWNKTTVTETIKKFSDNFKEISYFRSKFQNSEHNTFVAFNEGEGQTDIYELTATKENEMTETMCPLYKMSVDIEAMNLYLLSEIVKKEGGDIIYLNTDSVTFTCSHKINIDGYYWDSEKTVPKYRYEENPKTMIVMEKMKGYSRSEKFELSTTQMTTLYNDDGSDDFDKIAKIIIDKSQSCFIEGMAGCGKTTLLNKIKSLLGDKVFCCVTPTNASAMLVNGLTIHRFLIKAFSSKKILETIAKTYDYIFVDEISMINYKFFSALQIIKRLSKNRIKFILSGDFEQLPVINDLIRNANYKDSCLLKELADSNKVSLTKCRRSDSDGVAIFNYNNDIVNNKRINIKPFETNKLTFYNIAKTNKKRCEINSKCMENFETDSRKIVVPHIAKPNVEHDTQDAYLCKNMPLISKVNKQYKKTKTEKTKQTKQTQPQQQQQTPHQKLNDKLNVKMELCNNERVIIKDVSHQWLSIVRSTGEELKYKTSDFHKMFRVGFCVTTYVAQGATISEPFTIHEWDQMDKAHQYVAFSRANKLELINIKH